ncbi:MAG TPA: AAA family ATPase [Bryobacteraceae bacterium]|jgi:hypothetical protein|nr:AAA family ATPase [Bryobacteraceae bacterium]
MSTLSSYANAGYPAVAIATTDEDRSISNLVAEFRGREIWRIAAKGGLTNVRENNKVIDLQGGYSSAFATLAKTEADAAAPPVLVVLDYQHVIKNAAAYRELRDTLVKTKPLGTLIVLIAPQWQFPAELSHDIPVIFDTLPTREELSAALDITVRGAVEASDWDGQISTEVRNQILDAARGLTLGEAEGAMAMAFDGTQFRVNVVTDEKLKMIKASGFLTVMPPVDPDKLGGLGLLREYVRTELLPVFRDPDLRPRGGILVGIPGTGKSLSVRIIGAILGIPVVRCNIGELKGGTVGQSERQMKETLALAEAIAPCILYFDEFEKGVAGYKSSGQTDSGVTIGMVGQLATWLQDHTSEIFSLATVNDPFKLPAELTRAGRFDQMFFVDLPSKIERREIAEVHLRRWEAATPELCQLVADLSDTWTGAEIENCVLSAARQTRKQITAQSLRDSAKNIRPIARTRADEIDALRKYGREELRAANTPDGPVEVPTGRKVKAQSPTPIKSVINPKLN